VSDAAVLYSTDGAGLSYLRCGKIEGVYATVDFGTGNKLFSCSFMLHFTVTVKCDCSVLNITKMLFNQRNECFGAQSSKQDHSFISIH
jgi:hypothetical protein